MKGRNNQYYAHDYQWPPNAVLCEDFIHYKAFEDFAKANGMQICYCPLNVASTMVSNYKVFKPKDYETYIFTTN